MALTDYDVYQGLNPIEAIDQAITDIDTVKTYIPSSTSAQNKLVTESDIETDMASKQDSLTTAQMAAVNSGATAEIIESIGDKQDALSTTQMAAVNSGITQTKVSEFESIDSEVVAARVDAKGDTYTTLKDRIDSENEEARKVTKKILDDCDLDNLTGNNTYLLAENRTYVNSPLSYGILMTYELNGNWRMQLMYAIGQHGIYKRTRNVSSIWTDWMLIEASPSNELGTNTDKTLSQSFMTLNNSGFARSADEYTTVVGGETHISLADIKNPGYYLINTNWIIDDAPYGSYILGVKVEKYVTGDYQRFLKQTVESVGSVGDYYSYYRYTNYQGQYLDWRLCGRKGLLNSEHDSLSSCDLNTLTTDSVWLMIDSQTYENAPSYDSLGHSVGVLMHFNLANGWKFQIWYSFSSSDVYKRIGKTNNWQNWYKIAGGGNVYNITNEYTVEATPTITSDTNNYLAPTGDNTDVKLDIITMLTQNGVCRLGAGDYYVSGIDMPDDTMLIGSGAKTRVILLGSNSTTGYAIKLGNRCSVKDMSIVGSTTDIRYSDVSSSIVDRHGILFEAQYDYDESNKERCNIENVWIRFFTGGGITCRNTGYGTASCLNVSNAYIYQCNAGVYIPYWSEFHRFTNVHAHNCYYGAVNNGGNCSFVNCCFSSNRVGMLMDNSTDQARNNSHGQVVACIFDHADENNGIGILIEGQKNGEIFSDCQVFYSDIVVRNSTGIQFNNFNFGGGNVDIVVESGVQSGLVMFSGCVFAVGSYTITVDPGYDNCKFVNCWTRSGTAVTG